MTVDFIGHAIALHRCATCPLRGSAELPPRSSCISSHCNPLAGKAYLPPALTAELHCIATAAVHLACRMLMMALAGVLA